MRRTFLVSLLAVSALLAAACGGDTEQTSPADALVEAAATTQDAGSARFSIVTSMKASAARRPAEVSGEGLFDYRDRKGRMTFDISSIPGSGGALSKSGRMQVLFDGLTMYMNWPFLSKVLPVDEPWVKVDLQKLGESAGIDVGQLAQVGQTDPTQSLEYLKAAGDVEEVGSDRVRGVDTTQYHAVVDLREVARNGTEQVASSVERLIAATGTAEVPADVWIDSNGLLRRMSYRYRVSQGALGASSVSVTMDLFDFGVEVDVTPPPPNQVTDLTKLISRQAP